MINMDIDYSELPLYMQRGFKNYIECHLPMGRFGMAALENDLRAACANADSTNKAELFNIVKWIYGNAPSPCCGSIEKVKDWLSHHGA